MAEVDMMQKNSWLISMPKKNSVMNLYCFNHAGGLPGEYLRLFNQLADVSVYGIQLPGRGARINEKPFTNMEELSKAIVSGVSFEPPFVFFGHSFGGLLAFEVTRLLRSLSEKLPKKIFLSSSFSPPFQNKKDQTYLMDDKQLLLHMELSGWNAIPLTIHQNPTLLTHSLSALRADLQIFETYEYCDEKSLECPMMVMGGQEEKINLADWKRHTTGDFDLFKLPGGHFYFRQEASQFLHCITAGLNKLGANHEE